MEILLLILWLITLAAGIFGWVTLRRKNEEIKRISAEALDTERTINYFATSMFGRNTVEDVLWDITKNCISKLNFEDCVIYLYDKERNSLMQKAAYGPKNPYGYEILNPVEIKVGEGIVGSVFESGRAEIIPDTTEDPRYIEDDTRRYSEITVPIIFRGKKIGVIDAEHSKKNFFNEKHLHILTIIASLCANKIEQANHEEAYLKAEMKLAENNRKFANLKFISFLHQLKPKYVIQILRSISKLIDTGKSGQAKEYLETASDYFNILFNNTQSDWIPLMKEIQLLDKYCKLQQMNFSYKFQYQVITDPSISNAETILVPPLMIQPFVEQAILNCTKDEHKEGKLLIRIWITNDRLYFNIEDNGKYPDEETIVKEPENTYAPALKYADKRISIMNEMYHTGISYTRKENAFGTEGNKTIISMMMRNIPSND